MAIDKEQLPAGPVRFQFRSQATVGDRAGELVIEAESFKDLCKAVRLVNEVSPPVPSLEWRTLPDGTPICPKHGVPMKLRERQGDQWYSHNMGGRDDDLWCRGYPGKDSPGYGIEH